MFKSVDKWNTMVYNIIVGLIGGDFMVIKANKEIEVSDFVSDLHRAELDIYSPDELRAFCKGVRCALASLGVDDNTVCDVREWFEHIYFKFED